MNEAERLDALYDEAYKCKNAKEADNKRAAELFQEAAEGGHIKAAYQLGYMYLRGRGVIKDTAKAGQLFQTAAAGGHPEALFTLGEMYFEGEFFRRDTAKGILYLTKAAQTGNHSAEYVLGMIYLDGNGVPKDLDQARHWLQEAANGGHSEAKAKLQALDRKEPAAQTVQTAAQIEPAAAQTVQTAANPASPPDENDVDWSDIEFVKGGNYTADDFYKFGLDYGNGRNGVAWDLHKAEKCFLQAARMGNTQAPVQLVLVYSTWEDRENTFKWSLKVAEQGNEEMQFYVGHCLDVGYGVKEDTREALKWYVPLADKGHKDSQIKACLAFKKLGDEKMAAHYEKMAEHSIKKERKAASIPPGRKRKFSGSYLHLAFCVFLMLVALVPVLSSKARQDFINRYQAYTAAGGKIDATFYVWGLYFLGAFLYPIANRSYYADEIKQRRRERTWNSVKTAAEGAGRHANNYTYTETTWSDGSRTDDEAAQKLKATATAPAVFVLSGAALLILPILFLPFTSIFTLISNYVFNTKPK